MAYWQLFILVVVVVVVALAAPFELFATPAELKCDEFSFFFLLCSDVDFVADLLLASVYLLAERKKKVCGDIA